MREEANRTRVADAAPPAPEEIGERSPPTPPSVDDQIKLDEMALRKDTAARIVGMFTTANAFILLATTVIFMFDVHLMAFHGLKAEDRLINRDILMALIGATTVQLGVIMVAIARYLFPNKG